MTTPTVAADPLTVGTSPAASTGGSFDVFSLLLFFLVSALFVYDKLTSGEVSEAETARRAFANDEISHDELVRRLEVTECPETDKIRNAVEPVPRIGEEISFAIAERYDTLAALQRASVEELQTVPGVGEQKAQAIVERLGDNGLEGGHDG